MHGDGQVGDVDADPPAPQLLRRGDGCAASAERIQHDVARIAAGQQDIRSSKASGFCVGYPRCSCQLVILDILVNIIIHNIHCIVDKPSIFEDIIQDIVYTRYVRPFL